MVNASAIQKSLLYVKCPNCWSNPTWRVSGSPQGMKLHFDCTKCGATRDFFLPEFWTHLSFDLSSEIQFVISVAFRNDDMVVAV